MQEVLPCLYVGDWQEAQAGANLFGDIITVAVDSPFRGNHIFGLVDGPGNSVELMHSAVDRVVQSYRNHSVTLVHCVAGASRSPAVVAGAMKVILNVPLEEAIRFLRDRYNYRPNEALLATLREAIIEARSSASFEE